MYRVKICGIKTEKELEIACKYRIYGVSAVGFISGAIYDTPDEITPDRVGYFLARLPMDVLGIVVTHLDNFETIKELLDHIIESYKSHTGYNTYHSFALQLQNNISLEDIKKIKQEYQHVFLVKTIHVPGKEMEHQEITQLVHETQEYTKEVDLILLDSRTENKIGGTGKTHNWNVSKTIVDQIKPFPVALAGGLNPSNVKTAIYTVKPFGVDANSGLKGEDGFKDEKKVKEFFKEAYDAFCDIIRRGKAWSL